MQRVYRLIRWLTAATLRPILHLRVTGQELVPPTGPLLVAANHRSYIDFLVLGVALERPLTFLVAAEYFRPRLLRRLLLYFGAIPTERRRADASVVGTLRRALRVLRGGGALAIFPEGRATTQALSPRPGIGWLAIRTGAPVLPVAIIGTAQVWPRGARRPRRHRVGVRIGPVLRADGAGGPTAEAAVADRVMAAIESLTRGA